VISEKTLDNLAETGHAHADDHVFHDPGFLHSSASGNDQVIHGKVVVFSPLRDGGT